ncbi:MAG TPA: BMP family ABC transporter substrate-binding protein [Kineosporiaceae bacterium]|nr:BMP family ABC transporter substrate-binding protein [Kineosporiaceae bacterium]
MRSLANRGGWGAFVAVTGLGLALSACASNGDTATPAASSVSSGTPAAAAGTVPPGEPDVNGDGKVVIGVLSPGDVNDHGYYESFVTSAEAFATAKGWSVIKRGSVAPTDALNAARALCAQKVDLVALGAADLADAIPASEDPVCAKTAWYVPSSQNIDQTPKIFLSSDVPDQSMLAAGYAAGLVMQAKKSTKAGFIAGPEADYSVAAANGFTAGIRELIPDAKVLRTYIGDANDPAKGKEAAQAQISQSVSVLYPYLGGATDAVTTLANASGVEALTPGTDRCDSTAPKYAISVLFSPGDYFESALKQFANGTLGMGITKVWQLGADPYPTVKLCNGSPEQNAKLADFMKKIGSGELDTSAEVARLGK